MNAKIFIALVCLLCLGLGKTAPYSPHANPNCTTPFCTTCADPATCDVCDGQYYLNANTCATCNSAVTKCVNCTYNAGTTQVDCSLCDVGYYSQGPQACIPCINDVPFCLTCTNDGTTTTCSVCQDGYFLSAPNTCTPCKTNIPDCALCAPIAVAPFAVCNLCITNYIVDNNGACVACSLYINECNTCNQVGKTCDTCIDGDYRKTSGTACSPCTDLVTNCVSCVAVDDAGTAITCNKCQTDTYPVGNTCVTCGVFITGCAACNTGNNTCDTCSPGDYRKDKGNVCDLCDNAIKNCAECNALDDAGLQVTCTRCAPNTIPDGANCVACAEKIKFCDTCDTVASTCTTCSLGYFRKTSGQSCNPCTEYIAFCSECTAIDDAGSNITCSACAPNNFLVGLVCQPCVTVFPNCATCASQTVCTTCLPAFYATLAGDTCKVCSEVASCLTCSNNGQDAATCLTCGGGLVVSKDNTCVSCGDVITDCDLCVQNAKTFDVTCNGCGNGKVLADDKLSCLESSSSTIIIVSAVVGGVVLLGAGFAIFKCMKKRKSPLLEEDYEKI